MAEKRESNKLHDEAFMIRNHILENKLDHLRHLTYEEVCDVLGIYHEKVKPKSKSVGKLHIDVEVSDALKGLKAVTREAKNAVDALKQLKELKTNVNWYEVGGHPSHRDKRK